MSKSTQTARAKIIQSKNEEITNLSVSTSETSHVLNNTLKQIMIRLRENDSMRIAFVSTETGTKYFTIPKNATLTLSDLDFSSKTLYIRTENITGTAEILELY